MRARRSARSASAPVPCGPSGEERVDLEHAELAERGRLDLADQRAEVEVAAGPPGVLDQVREEDVLRLESGSAATPTRPSRLVTVALDLVAECLRLGVPGERGARNEPITFRGTPPRSRACTASRRPRPSTAGFARAHPLGGEALAPARRGLLGERLHGDALGLRVGPFTHGWKLAGARSGNVSARLPMSPFGSMISAGMPASSASSSRTTASPVLPEPVMPTTTPWVVRSPEPMTRSLAPGLPVAGSTILPRWNEPRSATEPSLWQPEPVESPDDRQDQGHTGHESRGSPSATQATTSASRARSRRPPASTSACEGREAGSAPLRGGPSQRPAHPARARRVG